MEYFLQTFGEVPLSTVVVFVAAISFIMAIGTKSYKFIVKAHDDIQNRESNLQSLKEDIQEIKEKQESQDKKMETMATKGELQEIQGREETLEQILNEIRQKQEVLVARQESYEEKKRFQDQNRLRDVLLQSYRYYTNEDINPMKAWSEMEQDAFNRLFKDYEELGGNGFMHSTVEPEMALLEVIEMSNQNRLAELMKSRRG